MKKWIKAAKTFLPISLIVLLMPVIIGGIVSIVILPQLETSNDWIGFWGSYAGSVVGGIITLLVMKKTLESNRQNQERDEKRQLCMYIVKLVSDFCIATVYKFALKILEDNVMTWAISCAYCKS